MTKLHHVKHIPFLTTVRTHATHELVEEDLRRRSHMHHPAVALEGEGERRKKEEEREKDIKERFCIN